MKFTHLILPLVIALCSVALATEPGTTIGGYQLSPSKNSFTGTEQLLDKLDEKLKPLLASEIGKEPTTDRLLNFKKIIESVTASSDRVGSRVVDVQTSSIGNQKIMLQFNIDLGEKVEFGFIGNKTFSKSDLQDLINEQKQIGLGRDYIETIRNKISAFYNDHAFARVKITTRTQENPAQAERKIIYMIEEGERIKIGELSFEGGIAISQEDLKKKFFENSPPIIEKRYFSEKEIEKTAQGLVEWIKSQGYLSAKLITVKPTLREDEPISDVKVYLNEGDQTIVRSVQVQGNTVYSTAEIQQMLGLIEGTPLNVFSFNDGLETVKLAYRNQGNLEFTVVNEGQPSVIQYSNKNRWADVVLEFKEGERFKAGSIRVEGNEKTKDDIVLRELQFAEGEVLEERRIFESEARLRRLGIFSDVKTKTIQNPEHSDVKDIIVSVQEASRGIASTGVGFRNDIGIRVFGDLTYGNLFRSNHTLGLGAFMNRRLVNVSALNGQPIEGVDYEARTNYTWPWFLVKELSFRPEVLQRKFRYELFRDETTQISFSFERPIVRKWGLMAQVMYSLQRTNQSAAVNPQDNVAFTIGSITPSITWDRRDSPLSPSKGFFFNVSYEIASPVFGGQAKNLYTKADGTIDGDVAIAYNRILTRSDFHIPVAHAGGFYFSVRTGFVKNTVSPSDYPTTDLQHKVGVPLVKQFALGGINSVRGFIFQGINVVNKTGQITDFQILGTLAYVNYRSQFDFIITDSLKMGPFFDAANLMIDDFSFNRDMRYGAGVGLRYMTPIGPANFDWGFNLNPQIQTTTGQQEPSNQFYFSLGVI